MAVILIKPVLPYALAFAAGAMIFVVVEVIPESYLHGNPDAATLGALLGIVVIMVLDVGARVRVYELFMFSDLSLG